MREETIYERRNVQKDAFSERKSESMRGKQNE